MPVLDPPPLRLRPGARAARLGDDLVLLDLPGDRYLGLPGAWSGGRLEPEAERLLRQAGLWDDRSAGVGCDLGWPRPQQDLPVLDAPPLAARDLLEIGRFLADYGWARRSPRLARLAAWAAQSRLTEDPQPSAALIAEAARLRRLLLWTPAPRKCLLQSFLLLRALRRRGLDARWVFAVRAWPFLAHCWLQAGPMVLDDRHERLCAFTPILVI